jgi:glutamyl-tRNA reductase
VSNRSFERAQSLAAEFGGRAVRFDDCFTAMAEADIVVCSTGCPHTILHREEIVQVMAARRNRPLALVDIAVPRNIATDVQEINNVYLYDVDDLEVIVRENVKHREQEMSRCESIISERTEAVLAKITPSREGFYQPQIPSRLDWTFSAAAA